MKTAPKKTAFIVPAAIKSHIIPSFFLAKQLEQEYNIYYLVTDENLRGMIEQQQYHFIHLKTNGIGFFAEHGFVEKKYKQKSAFFKAIKKVQLYLSNALYRERKREIQQLVEGLSPEIVLIDIFNTTHFVFFSPYRKKIASFFFSPMLSTHHAKGLSGISAQIGGNENLSNQKIRFKYFSEWADHIQLLRCCWLAGIPRSNRLSRENNFTTYYFKNVKELVLAPLELELDPRVRNPDQHYMGLCTILDRQQSAIDQSFNIDPIVDAKKDGMKIVYCSFGTFFHSLEQHRAVIFFVTKLIEAVSGMEDVRLILALNKKVMQVIQETVPEVWNVYVYGFVPQVQVLELSDLFITHGGLGSVKESIYCRVPMLVYPLDYRWDQPGNALKVLHHGLGKTGLLRTDTAEDISNNIAEVLGDNQIKQRITRFSESIQSENIWELLKKEKVV